MLVKIPEEQPAYKGFVPRADQPERYDQQTTFYNSSHPGVTRIIAGNAAGTTEVALAKVARFVMETEPPRKDTPFWIISASYEMVCKAWEQSSGRGVNPRDAKPQPLKKDDHAVDALRYLVFTESQKTGYTPRTMQRDRSWVRRLVPLSNKR